MTDDAAMQAECVVRALDAYLATMPWPAPTAHTIRHSLECPARHKLVATIAAALHMSEPRKSALQEN
jgi:hypothetical protein